MCYFWSVEHFFPSLPSYRKSTFIKHSKRQKTTVPPFSFIKADIKGNLCYFKTTFICQKNNNKNINRYTKAKQKCCQHPSELLFWKLFLLLLWCYVPGSWIPVFLVSSLLISFGSMLFHHRNSYCVCNYSRTSLVLAKKI